MEPTEKDESDEKIENVKKELDEVDEDVFADYHSVVEENRDICSNNVSKFYLGYF